MARIPLLGGAYSARSIIASAQRCVNLYPERTPESSSPPTPVTHYLTPGLVTLVTPAVAAVRCLFRATNDRLYAVIGNSVYYLDAAFAPTLLGTIAAGSTPVSMTDNGTVAVIVDGTTAGYVVNITTNVMTTIADPAFYGADRVVCIDGWLIFNRPLTNQFYLSPVFWDGIAPFDALYIASKVGGPDRIISIAALRGELWLIGALTTEIWFNAGAADFPFARQPGVLIEHGMLRGYTVSEVDVNVFWLGRDRQGRLVVFMGKGYEALRVSTSAIEDMFQVSTGPVSDAVGFTYQEGGHTFYVLTFPTTGETWVYDLLTGEWHQRTWTNPATGAESRIRPNCYAFANNRNVVGDWENGKIYWMTQASYSDDGNPIVRRRGFPHLMNDGKVVSYSAFIADMDVNNTVAVVGTPTLYLRWSDTRGATWEIPIEILMDYSGTDPKYRSLAVRRLGRARDRVFELYWSFANPTALNGAFVEVEPAET